MVDDDPICVGDWCPHDFEAGYLGPITLTTALAQSINTVAVRLAQAVGRQPIVDLAHKMGITNDLPIVRALPLGVDTVNVIDMAASYGAFATGGFKVTPYAFTEITNGDGKVIWTHRDHAPAPQRVLDDKIVAEMNGMLVNVPEWGTGTAAKLDGIRTAGKTGTTSDFRDAWFVGFTGNYIAAVWMGNDDFSQTKTLTGGILPAQIWKQVMTYAHQGVILKPIPFLNPAFEAPPKGQAVAAGAPPLGPIRPGLQPAGMSAATAERLSAIRDLLQPTTPANATPPASSGATPPSPASTAALPAAAPFAEAAAASPPSHRWRPGSEDAGSGGGAPRPIFVSFRGLRSTSGPVDARAFRLRHRRRLPGGGGDLACRPRGSRWSTHRCSIRCASARGRRGRAPVAPTLIPMTSPPPPATQACHWATAKASPSRPPPTTAARLSTAPAATKSAARRRPHSCGR